MPKSTASSSTQPAASSSSRPPPDDDPYAAFEKDEDSSPDDSDQEWGEWKGKSLKPDPEVQSAMPTQRSYSQMTRSAAELQAFAETNRKAKKSARREARKQRKAAKKADIESNCACCGIPWDTCALLTFLDWEAAPLRLGTSREV